MKKIRSLCLFLLVLVQVSFAQMKRADKYYNNYDYAKAIELYKNVLRKGDNPEALEKLANSYRLTKNYQQAEIYYEKLVKIDTIAPINYFYYGTVLKNNKKPEAAREQFKKYSAAFPDDKKVASQFKSLDDVKVWVSNAQQYEINTFPFNTSHEEFSPVIYKNQIAYSSSQKKDLINESKDDWDAQPFLNIVTRSFKRDTAGNYTFSKSSDALPSPINTEYHDGPMCLNTEQNMAFVTRVDNVVNKKDKNFVNRPKLYIFELKGNKWKQSDAFPYNSDSYSILHPSVSDDGLALYFASDIPGGQGGTDIYVCKKEGTSWGQPQNLGADVNTTGNEVFPYIRKDGKLFFSSDTHPGFGGLDVFSAVMTDGKFGDVKNMGFPFNTSTDDFGVFYNDDNKTGFLSSDRPGGKGSDDIYGFKAQNNFIAVTGKILLSKNINDPAKGVEVNLLASDGTIVKLTTTDTTGFFRFENLDPDKTYMVKLNENDPNLKKNNEYYMADQDGKIVRVTVINDKGGKFVFTNLPYNANSLSQMNLDEVNLGGNLLFGENPSKPMAGTKVNLVNEKGEILQTAVTNELGGFVFTKLPPDQKYFVKIDESDTRLAPDTKIVITNVNGKEIQVTRTDKTGKFKFEFIATDEHTLAMMKVEDSDLKFNMKAFLLSEKKDPLANTIINLIDAQGNILRSVKTDSKGGFLFTDLHADNNLLFAVDENDAGLKNYKTLYLSDASGKIIKEITKSNGVFRFSVLPNVEKDLGTVYAEDPEIALQKKLNSADKLEWKAYLVDDKKNPVADAGISLMDANNEIIKNIRTDAKGSFFFEKLPGNKKMLFMVDESDARLKDLKILYIIDENGNVLKEIVKSGGRFIFTVLPGDEKKLGIVAEDDTQLAANKKMNEKNKNLRFEWEGIMADENKQPLINTGINILNENKELIKKIKTNEKGAFLFSELPADKNLLFSVDENDAVMKNVKMVYILDKNGSVVKEVIKKNGKFSFTILPEEEKTLGRIYTEDTWLAVSQLKKDNASGVITNVENLYYDYGKADLLPEAKQVLDKVIGIMKEDEKLKVVVESHTDSRSSYGFNIRLSRQRAQVVVDYMIGSGISKDRVKGKGFGETRPINKCKDGVQCSEEEFAKNRRTEFKIYRRK